MRVRAQEKVFVLSPLSITFLDIIHFPSDCKQDKRSDRCVIEGGTSITSITGSEVIHFYSDATTNIG